MKWYFAESIILFRRPMSHSRSFSGGCITVPHRVPAQTAIDDRDVRF